MGSWQLRVGAIQLCSSNDLSANLARCRELTAQAAAEGARLVVLPECFSFLGRAEGEKLGHAEIFDAPAGPATTPVAPAAAPAPISAIPAPPTASAASVLPDSAAPAPLASAAPAPPAAGPVLAALRELATRHGIWIVGGGTPERVPGDARRTYNTAIVVDPRGELVARYRKIHLFDVEIPGGAVLRESDSTARGDELVVVDIDGAPVGVSICYDVRFPELYRKLVKDLGAEVLLVPAAFTAHTGAAHWHLLLRARAIEDQAWVIAAAQWGRHSEKRESYGHSLIVDPWGTITGERAEGDGVVVATIDGATVAKRRTQMPCLSHAVMWR